jgi:predicted TPR repeat methyltransferase
MADDALGSAGEGLAAQFAADPAEVAAMYDDWVPARYDADLEDWGYDAPARAADLVLAHIGDGDRPILDAGCGSGLVGVELRRRGLDHLVGGDFSPRSVEIARERSVYDEVFELDLNVPLDFDDDAFRAAVSVGVFSYLRDPEATIRELLRVVEPGGPLVFTQRTDLWEEFAFPGLLRHLADDVVSDVTVSSPEPYLPGHPEFGDDIGIHYVTLIASC